MNVSQALVVTLRRATARQPQVQRILQTSPVPCQIHDAVDGKLLPDDELQRWIEPRLHSPSYPFPLNVGEVGCFLSHRGIWQRIVDEGWEQTLIVEDDIEFEPGFAESLAFASEHARSGDYVQFQVRPFTSPHRVLSQQSKWALLCPDVIPLRTSAQLVTKLAAERLLAASSRLDRPVDAFIQMRWVTGVRVVVMNPSCVHEVSANLGGSTIGGGGKRQAMTDRVKREILRPIYRFQIASRSRKDAA